MGALSSDHGPREAEQDKGTWDKMQWQVSWGGEEAEEKWVMPLSWQGRGQVWTAEWGREDEPGCRRKVRSR